MKKNLVCETRRKTVTSPPDNLLPWYIRLIYYSTGVTDNKSPLKSTFSGQKQTLFIPFGDKKWIKSIALSSTFNWEQWEKEATALADCGKNMSHNLLTPANNKVL